jgi:hypothetical protein
MIQGYNREEQGPEIQDVLHADLSLICTMVKRRGIHDEDISREARADGMEQGATL